MHAMPANTNTWLASYGWLANNLPLDCSAEWKSKFFDVGVALGAFGGAPPVTASSPMAAGNGKFLDSVLAQIQQSGAAGMTLAQLETNLGKPGNTISRTLSVLRKSNLINETADGLYVAIGARNIQGIGQAPRRGRPPLRSATPKPGRAAAAA